MKTHLISMSALTQVMKVVSLSGSAGVNYHPSSLMEFLGEKVCFIHLGIAVN